MAGPTLPRLSLAALSVASGLAGRAMPQGLRLGMVEPREAVAAFRAKQVLQPSFRWQDVWQDEHSRAMAVAGVQRLDVLQVFQDELDAAVAQGKDLDAFSKAITPRLVEKGWWGDVEIEDPDTGERRVSTFDRSRLRLIYETNTRQAYAAGRWQSIERGRAVKPLLMYRTMRDERVRASHRAWDGIALPIDHPFWETHYPPNGWRCRCTAIAVSEADLARLAEAGFRILRDPPAEQWIPYTNPRTGELTAIPRGIDPGFAYNPGKRRDAALADQALRKAARSMPIAASVAIAQASSAHPPMKAQLADEFATWVSAVLQAGHSAQELRFIGALDAGAVRALERAGRAPVTAAVAVRDVDVLHALRQDKVDQGRALPREVYERLPEMQARALLMETSGDALLYVVDVPDSAGRVAQLVLRLDVPLRTRVDDRMTRVPLNILRTATMVNPQALQDRKRYQLVWGSLEKS